jgi:uncharacterized membrane protein
VILVLWLAMRASFVTLIDHEKTVSVVDRGWILEFLHIDFTWLAFLPLALLWWAWPPTRRQASLLVVVMTTGQAATFAFRSIVRYWGGSAGAWDLGHFAHPIWRSMHGYGLVSTWHGDGDLPLWGDHGNLAVVLFAPLGLFRDPAAAILVAQAIAFAAWIPAVYAFGRAKRLEVRESLLMAAVALASRPIENGATFDFHPECLLPVAFIGMLWAHASRRRYALVGFALLGASTRETAAATIAAALVYLAWSDRRMRRLSLWALAAVLALLVVGTQVIPRFTDWPSYTSNTREHAAFSVELAAKTTFMRSANTLVLPWAHPFTWVAGLPWAAAVSLHEKSALRGIEFHYGILVAPVAAAGGVMLYAWVRRRLSRSARGVLVAWAIGVVAVNGARPIPVESYAKIRARHEHDVAFLSEMGLDDPEISIATDQCSAVHLVNRRRLVPVCYIATDLTWFDVPIDRPFTADRIVVRQKGCSSTRHSKCVYEQLRRAADREGFQLEVVGQGFMVFRRTGERTGSGAASP